MHKIHTYRISPQKQFSLDLYLYYNINKTFFLRNALTNLITHVFLQLIKITHPIHYNSHNLLLLVLHFISINKLFVQLYIAKQDLFTILSSPFLNKNTTNNFSQYVDNYPYLILNSKTATLISNVYSVQCTVHHTFNYIHIYCPFVQISVKSMYFYTKILLTPE